MNLLQIVEDTQSRIAQEMRFWFLYSAGIGLVNSMLAQKAMLRFLANLAVTCTLEQLQVQPLSSEQLLDGK